MATDDKFPPLAERMCHKVGLMVIDADGEPSYDWHAVQSQWNTHPGTNFKEFCKQYHLPYGYAKQRVEIKAEDKRVSRFRALQTHKLAMMAELAVHREATLEEDAERLHNTLRDIETVAAAGVRYARARLMKEIDGEMIVNPVLRPSEVKKCMEIGLSAAIMLRNAMELGNTVKPSENADREPAPQSLPPGTGFKFTGRKAS